LLRARVAGWFDQNKFEESILQLFVLSVRAEEPNRFFADDSATPAALTTKSHSTKVPPSLPRTPTLGSPAPTDNNAAKSPPPLNLPRTWTLGAPAPSEDLGTPQSSAEDDEGEADDEHDPDEEWLSN